MSFSMTTKCNERLRFILAFLNSSKHASDAAGGGIHTYDPFSIFGLQNPSESIAPPFASCPLTNQSLGVKNVDSFGSQVDIHCYKAGEVSVAVFPHGKNSIMSHPTETLSRSDPRETPSVPCSIMRVPATWVTSSQQECSISKLLSLMIKE